MEAAIALVVALSLVLQTLPAPAQQSLVGQPLASSLAVSEGGEVRPGAGAGQQGAKDRRAAHVRTYLSIHIP